tara:strand:+ start:646 stop:915 length:270 start_codon:yes stop_codon:yes gene_type:complete
MTKAVIPELSTNSTWEDIKKYLTWLSDSRYQYHLDDMPDDIIWYDDDEMDERTLRILSTNHNILWGYRDSNITDSNIVDAIWENYFQNH